MGRIVEAWRDVAPGDHLNVRNEKKKKVRGGHNGLYILTRPTGWAGKNGIIECGEKWFSIVTTV